jgi:hypothetical protein
MKDNEQVKVYRRDYRQANLEHMRALDRSWRDAHREKRNAQNRAWSQAHPERHRTRSRNRYQALRAEALRILGSKCACPGCEVSEPPFLTIDHINGRPKGRRKDAITEAKASGWDKTKFQILCANCNFAKSARAFCPVHQKAPGARNGHSPVGNAQLSFGSLE